MSAGRVGSHSTNPFFNGQREKVTAAYYSIITQNGTCDACDIACKCSMSWDHANRAIVEIEMDELPPLRPKGQKYMNGRMPRLTMEHHCFIYSLFIGHPTREASSYIEEFKWRYGQALSHYFINKWFQTIGPFKSIMRLTLTIPRDQKNFATLELLDRYMFFMAYMNRSRLVFAAKSTIDKKDIVHSADTSTDGEKDSSHQQQQQPPPPYSINDSFSVCAAVSLKEHAPFCTRAMHAISPYKRHLQPQFENFIAECLHEGVLAPYDILVMDTSIIPDPYGNVVLQDFVWNNYSIIYVPLPPACPKLNPAELVTRDLKNNFQKSPPQLGVGKRGCDLSSSDALRAVKKELQGMTYERAKLLFFECGYPNP